MIGIENIGYYIPHARISNYLRKEKFSIDDEFITEKLGIEEVSLKGESEETSDLCVKAFEHLQTKQSVIISEIDCVVVVTQNPDNNIPHTSAIVHEKLDLSENCACFDVSLGCSGFVYGLSIIQNFMQENGFKKGLLFAADPYSKVIVSDDKNTATLFGDAASVTLLSENYSLSAGKFNFGTIGKKHRELICTKGELYMNGRAIFNFAAKYVPKDIPLVLEKNNININDVDLFIFHQGSKFIVDTITKRLKIDSEKVPFVVAKYGNTVSSSIPILLEKYLKSDEKHIVISGFGVGLSWASTVLTRK